MTKKLTSSKSGIKVIYKAVDIGDYEAVNTAVQASVKEIGHIDILVNNVGSFDYCLAQKIQPHLKFPMRK